MNPADPKRNEHHTKQYRSEYDWWECNFGKGPSDPDRFDTYPGQEQ